jgi:hypothetical protein
MDSRSRANCKKLSYLPDLQRFYKILRITHCVAQRTILARQLPKRCFAATFGNAYADIPPTTKLVTC